LPPDIDSKIFARLLLVTLQQPEASVVELAQHLRADGLTLTADQIDSIFSFYHIDHHNRFDLVFRLLQKLRQFGHESWDSACLFPQQQQLDFPAVVPPGSPQTRILKTRRRKVVSLALGIFWAREVVRVADTSGGPQIFRSETLRRLVPPKCVFAYDIIVAVGIATLLEGTQLQELQRRWRQRSPALDLPLSTLWNLQRRFLFLLGAMHRQALPKLKEYLRQRGGYTALIDGTIEPPSPVLFGVSEAEEKMVLGSWKIPSENQDDISCCLKELATEAGCPKRVMHDLSEAIAQACSVAFAETPQRVCHFHFVRVVGQELYASAQAALAAAWRRHKLTKRFHNQRKMLTQRLAKEASKPTAGKTPAEITSVLSAALHQKGPSTEVSKRLIYEALLAFHHYLQDYGHDGQGEGYPFDPSSLYQHRRLAAVAAQTSHLLTQSQSQTWPRALASFHEAMQSYLSDPEVVEAAADWERRVKLFDRLRAALRLNKSDSSAPLSNRFLLDEKGEQKVASSLTRLRQQLERAREKSKEAWEESPEGIVLAYLEAYEGQLLVSGNTEELTEGGAARTARASLAADRTNNTREAQWRELKRGRRRVHGRSSLAKDLTSFPAELGLVMNLENQRYMKLVVGNQEELAEHFAAADPGALAYKAWLKKQNPLRPGHLPKRELRVPLFLAKVAAILCENEDNQTP
jgi:hypothetical protein